jgi:bifunctional non-homologous end joining protein LigD
VKLRVHERRDAAPGGCRAAPPAGRATSAAGSRTSPSLAAHVAALPGARPGPLPRAPRAQLATLVAAPPDGDGWLHEIKFDGYRILARLEDRAAG